MKIKSIYIKNFRSIKEETINFPKSGILALVGPNNAGKSNILKSINNILGETWFSEDKSEKNDYYLKDTRNKIDIKIIFDDDKSVEIDFGSSSKWPIYKDGDGRTIYGSQGNVKDDFPCTFLPAERSLEKNLQFRSYELMGKIAKRFNEKARDKKEEIESKFNEVMALLDTVDGFSQFKRDFVGFYNEMQSDTPYKLRIDFKAFSPLNYFKTINILANDSSVDEEFNIDVEELGEGNKSLILFSLLRSYAKNFKQDATGILAIEEPEIYLHPQARRHLYKSFWEITKDSNIQIIYTTHSPDFLSTENFSSLGIVKKDLIDGTRVTTITEQELVSFCVGTGVPSDKVNVDNIVEFYAATSNFRLNEGFFAKKLVLVEGETEEMCLPLLFERFGINTDSTGISFIAVNGKNQLPKYWRLFKLMGCDCYILFDNDDDGNGNKRQSNANISSCFNTTIEELINLSDGEIFKVLDTQNAQIFFQRLFILETDFETVMKLDYESYCTTSGTENKYEDYIDEARNLIKPLNNSQKGQIARCVLRKILVNNPNYYPAFVKKMIDNMGLGLPETETSSIDEFEIPDELPVASQPVSDLPF